MLKDLQKNNYSIKDKFFDFSKKGIIKFEYEKDEKINNGEDYKKLRKKHKVFRDYEVLTQTLKKAEDKSLIKITDDYSVLVDGMKKLNALLLERKTGGDISSDNCNKNARKSTSKRVNTYLTNKAEEWLENYQSGLDKLKRYFSKHLWVIFAIIISVIAIFK